MSQFLVRYISLQRKLTHTHTVSLLERQGMFFLSAVSSAARDLRAEKYVDDSS